MTLQAVLNGPGFPCTYFGQRVTVPLIQTTVGVVDATGEKVGYVGHVMWADGASHTMGATSKVHWRAGVSTFADAGTNLRIGLQDCISASGTTLVPDGTFDVYADLAGNGGGVTSNTANATTLSTSGSKTIAHADAANPIAIVFDLTARSGSDSVIVQGLNGTSVWLPPGALTHNATSWSISAGSMPNVMLEANDGTFGILAGVPYWSTTGTYNLDSSTNPDEIGLVFQVPFSCKVNGAWVYMGTNAAAADSTLALYSTPLGTPASMASTTILGEQGSGSTSARPRFYPFTEQTLSINTDYCIAVAATSTGNVAISYMVLADANHRTVQGLANCRAGKRQNGSGAFSETTTEIPLICLQVSALDDGAGAGGGGGPLIRGRLVA